MIAGVMNTQTIFKGVVVCTIGMLFGVLVARFVAVSGVYILSFSALLFLLSAPIRPLFLLGCMVLGVGLGIYRSEGIIENYTKLESFQGQKVEVVGSVSDDPKYHESGQLQFHVETTTVNGSPVSAMLRVRGYVLHVARGDTVRIIGTLRDGFAWWQGSIYYAEAEHIAIDSSLAQKFRNQVIANTYSHIPDPEASLGLGFLFGVRALLPEQLVTNLRVTGLTHIIAVSGYNLTILASITRRIFHRISRRFAVLSAFGLIGFFVLMTGMSPSILRAVIVSTVSLTGWYIARPVSPWLLLLYSSTVSAMIEPAYVWFDIGWYLSLTAFFGVLILAPELVKRFYKKREPGLFGQIVIETSCAQLLTLPVIMFVFGEVSVIALLANMLILPLIPLAMLVTSATSFTGFISWKLAAITALPAHLLLNVISMTITLLAQSPFALIELRLNANQLIFAYTLIIGLTLVFVARSIRRSSGILQLVKTEMEKQRGRSFKMGENQTR